MGIQDNERRRAGLNSAGPSRTSLGGTVADLRIARVQHPPAAEPVAASGAGRLPRIDSRSLFGGSREVVITHDGADYRLRVTASGKLILTK